MIKNLLKSLAILPIVTLVFSVSSARADGDIRNFTMVNDSSEPILGLYVSSVSTSNWEEDILGVETMPSDERRTITFNSEVAGRCMYDVRVTLTNGRDSVASGVNLCETASMIFDGSQLIGR